MPRGEAGPQKASAEPCGIWWARRVAAYRRSPAPSGLDEGGGAATATRGGRGDRARQQGPCRAGVAARHLALPRADMPRGRKRHHTSERSRAFVLCAAGPPPGGGRAHASVAPRGQRGGTASQRVVQGGSSRGSSPRRPGRHQLHQRGACLLASSSMSCAAGVKLRPGLAGPHG